MGYFNLDAAAILALYQENYNMAVTDGHADKASEIAWEWTEETVMNRFITIKANHQNAQQEAINKAFYG